MSLTKIFPQPVRITLAGRPFLAMELKVKELAELQAWRESHAPAPADRLGPRSGYPDRESYRARALELYDEAEAAADAAEAGFPAPETSTPAAPVDPVMARAMTIWAGLKDVNEGFMPADAADLALEIQGWPDGAFEWARLKEVVYALNPFLRLCEAIDPEFEAGGGGGAAWEKAIEEIRAASNLTYDQVGEMYLGQVDNIRSGGKPHGVPEANIPPGEDPVEYARKQRKKYYGSKNSGESTPVPPAPAGPPTELPPEEPESHE